MNSHPSPGGTPPPPTSRPENEDDDPVGDNQPVTGSTDPDAPEGHSEGDGEGDVGESNSGAVRTGDDGGGAPRRSSDADPADPAVVPEEVQEEVPEELPEGSDARPSDRLNGHHQEDFASGRAGRRPASDSTLPQHSRG